MSLHRFTLFLFCLILAFTASAVSLELSGSPHPSEMVCPGGHASEASAPAMDEVVVVPSLIDLEELMKPNEIGLSQNARPNFNNKRSRFQLIGFWGDSHLAAAFFSDEFVKLMGLSNADVKPSFLPPTMGRGGVRLPIRSYCKSSGWRFANTYTAHGEMTKVGPALTVLENMQDDVLLWVDFRYKENLPALEQLVIVFREIGDQSVMLEVGVDDAPVQQVLLKKGESQLQISGVKAFSQLKLRVVKGDLAIEGFAPSYISPAHLRLDIFGIPGATVRSWALVDPLYLRSRLTNPEYDLVIFEYGSNEGADRNFDSENYRALLTASLRGMKTVFPNAQCVLIGPPDRGLLVRKRLHVKTHKKFLSKDVRKGARKEGLSRGDLLKYASVNARIAEIQKSLAQSNSCVFWDWQLAMGGQGGAYKWFYRNPRLMAKDLLHLTKTGYQESARLFFDDIGIGEWIK